MQGRSGHLDEPVILAVVLTIACKLVPALSAKAVVVSYVQSSAVLPIHCIVATPRDGAALCVQINQLLQSCREVAGAVDKGCVGAALVRGECNRDP
jgi:hypothetical protein